MNDINTIRMVDCPPPPSIEIERAVICDLIAHQGTVVDAERLLNEASFSDGQCREAWTRLIQMHHDGEILDLPTVANKLDNRFVKDVIVPSSGNAISPVLALQHYHSLSDIAVRRQVFFAAVDMIRKAGSNMETIDDILSIPDQLSAKIRTAANFDRGPRDISEILNDLGEELERLQIEREQGKYLRVPTGIPDLDKLLYGGFDAGELEILAARPSVGKTALMLYMARAAASNGFPAVVFSLEMTQYELARRLLISTGDVDAVQLMRGEISWPDFETAVGKISKYPICIDDSSRSLEEIARRIILIHQQEKCSIAFVDYVGLVSVNNSRLPMNQAIGEITKRFKQVAKDCGIPIVLLSQLNRSSASEGRSPELYDLRDSGSLEQDADDVIMLEKSGECVNAWLRKNRNGKGRDVCCVLAPNSTYTNFTQIDVCQKE